MIGLDWTEVGQSEPVQAAANALVQHDRKRNPIGECPQRWQLGPRLFGPSPP
jgi:hypothetical protein